MTEKRRQKNTHLRSARQWLSRAEEAFDKDHNVRGELDLFLAQAELKHAQETVRSPRWQFSYPLLQHALALGLAVVVAAVGIGGAYWLTHSANQSRPAPAASSGAMPQTALKNSMPTPAPSEQREQPQAVSAVAVTSHQDSAPVKTVYPLHSEKQIQSEMTEKQLPADELQKLVRAAGKSLRGGQ